MEREPEALNDEVVNEELKNLVEEEGFDIKREKPDLRAALRVIEDMILKNEIDSSTTPAQIRDLIEANLKRIEDI